MLGLTTKKIQSLSAFSIYTFALCGFCFYNAIEKKERSVFKMKQTIHNINIGIDYTLVGEVVYTIKEYPSYIFYTINYLKNDIKSNMREML